MSDPNWNWGDPRGRASDRTIYDQRWQQQSSTYLNPTQQKQVESNIGSSPTSGDYYRQHATTYGVTPTYQSYSQPTGTNDSLMQQHQADSFATFGVPQDMFGVSSMGNFPQQIMADPMLSAAKQIGTQFAEQQKQKFAKYLSAFQLRYYFAVDNAYVGKKLGILLFPFFHTDWAVRYDNSDAPIPPRFDVNAPDLYIPIMAFVTYILISGFVLGIQGRFTPEQLGIITTNAMAYLIFENIIVFVTKYIMNISQALSLWHSLAYSSYKFVGMNVSLVAFLIGGKVFYYATLAYTSLAIVLFLLRTVKNFVLDIQSMYSYDEGKKRKLYLLLFISFTQPFIMWWLTSDVTAFVPRKLGFAQLALSGMGLNEAISKGQVPLLPDGEVDYEALLKMP